MGTLSGQKGGSVRVCDGCFNAVDAENLIPGTTKRRRSSRKNYEQQSEMESDASVFSSYKKTNKSTTSKVGSRAKNGIGEVQHQVNEARNKLTERGENLSRMADKSEEMVDASAKFKEMCKQINENSKHNSGWGLW